MSYVLSVRILLLKCDRLLFPNTSCLKYFSNMWKNWTYSCRILYSLISMIDFVIKRVFLNFNQII